MKSSTRYLKPLPLPFHRGRSRTLRIKPATRIVFIFRPHRFGLKPLMECNDP
jgi:hypothetical protein